jgi:hypothetical protein
LDSQGSSNDSKSLVRVCEMSEDNLAAIQRIIRSTYTQPTPTNASIPYNWSQFRRATVLQATAGAKKK